MKQEKTSEIWKKIKNSRSIRGKGSANAAEFILEDRQRYSALITENIKHQGKSTDITVIPLKEY